MATTTQHGVKYIPQSELILIDGKLFFGWDARYDTLEAYETQFEGATSSLPGKGAFTFVHPMHPNMTILVQCTREPIVCGQGHTEETCDCEF